MCKFYAFHGADHKVGTTMTAQAAAELIAMYRKDIKVMFLALNGRANAQYVKEDIRSIDDFKLELDSKIFTANEFMRKCRKKDNFYMLAGIENEEEERSYFPSMVEYLIGEIARQVDIIIADTGSTLDNGLAFGALTLSDCNFLVTTQNESALARLESRREVFEKNEVGFEKLIVNKFFERDPYSLGYILQRLELGKNDICKIAMADYERQAEMNHCTLIEFNDSDYHRDMLRLANEMSGDFGSLQTGFMSRGLKWKSFI